MGETAAQNELDQIMSLKDTKKEALEKFNEEYGGPSRTSVIEDYLAQLEQIKSN